MKSTLKLHPSDARTLFSRYFLHRIRCQPVVLFTEIPKPEFKEILFSVSRNPLAEELSKTSKTGDDFDDLAMTRKIVRVWNRSKVPTKSVPLKEIRQAGRCPIVF